MGKLLEDKIPYIWGCPICGGAPHKRLENKIMRRRRERAWKKDWRDNSYGE